MIWLDESFFFVLGLSWVWELSILVVE